MMYCNLLRRVIKYENSFSEKGDNLWIIAQKHNVDMETIIKANPQIQNPDELEVGMKIIIPHANASKEKNVY